MEQDDRLLNAMFEMCNHKNPLNDGQREWHIADISGLLREERYDELDERYNQAADGELYQPRSGKSAISSPGIKWTTLFTIWTRWLRLGRKD
ncbi:membrane protein [Salmonella enterica subsp. enterica]|uniref:Membrane protein n=1 Tax=Salmonella enterica I TaxID=59201 RepID=A0A447U058_SALET|nr:membrane protein [Salmonella enterica subsp. enterica]